MVDAAPRGTRRARGEEGLEANTALRQTTPHPETALTDGWQRAELCAVSLRLNLFLWLLLDPDQLVPRCADRPDHLVQLGVLGEAFAPARYEDGAADHEGGDRKVEIEHQQPHLGKAERPAE